MITTIRWWIFALKVKLSRKWNPCDFLSGYAASVRAASYKQQLINAGIEPVEPLVDYETDFVKRSLGEAA